MPFVDIVPGVPGEKGDLGRPVAEARQVEEIEILQRIGPDRLLGRLDRAASAGRDQLRRDFGVEDVVQDRGRLLVDIARGGDEADQVLDQRLGNRAVGIVVRHVIADAVGAPAQPQLGEIAGAHHHAVVLVGEAEQVIGAQPGLHVLEGDVVDLLALGEGMADVGQHLVGRRLDVDLGRRHAQRRHQPPGVLVGFVRRAEARQGIGQHVLARQAELVHRPAGHDQRLGRIEAARDADDRLLDAARLQALRQALDLDVVGLVAIVAQLGRIRRHVGKAFDGAIEGHAVAGRIEARRQSCGNARPCRPPASHSRRSRCCAAAPGGCGRDRHRRARWSSPSRSAAIRPAGRRIRRSRHGRPRPGRSSTRRDRRRNRRRPRCRAPTGCRTAGGAPRPCRW